MRCIKRLDILLMHLFFNGNKIVWGRIKLSRLRACMEVIVPFVSGITNKKGKFLSPGGRFSSGITDNLNGLYLISSCLPDLRSDASTILLLTWPMTICFPRLWKAAYTFRLHRRKQITLFLCKYENLINGQK